MHVACNQKDTRDHTIDLYILFPQCRSCDNTLQSLYSILCFIQIFSYSRAYVKTKRQMFPCTGMGKIVNNIILQLGFG